MADEADIANDFIANEVSRALGKMRRDGEVTLGPEECVKCEESIPMVRRQLGFNKCVACAEESERRKSQYANF